MAVQPIPAGYQSVTPYLFIRGAADAIEFYTRAFGATEKMRFPMRDGKIGHAEVIIGNSVIMLADENEQMDILGPQTRGGTTASYMLYVDEVDAQFERALQAGATVIRPVADQFYGDRTGCIRDPFGHEWTIGTHVEDVSMEEMQRRMSAMSQSHGS